MSLATQWDRWLRNQAQQRTYSINKLARFKNSALFYNLVGKMWKEKIIGCTKWHSSASPGGATKILAATSMDKHGNVECVRGMGGKIAKQLLNLLILPRSNLNCTYPEMQERARTSRTRRIQGSCWEKRMLTCSLLGTNTKKAWGPAQHRDSVRAYQSAALGSFLSISKFCLS